MDDVHCPQCSHHDDAAERGTADCPMCGAALRKRLRPSPRPATHFLAVIHSVVSVRGLAFLAGYVVLLIAPIPFSGAIATGLLYLAAIKLAWKAMSMEGDKIEFPSLATDELLDFSGLWAAIVFAVAFVVGPIALVATGVVAGGPWAIPLGIVAVALVLYSPMALVLFLNTGSSFAFFAALPGARLIAHNPLSYFSLAAFYFGAKAAGFFLQTGGSISVAMLLDPAGGIAGLLSEATQAAITLFSFGICGLYIRQHARVLAMPVDDSDWGPARTAVALDPLAPRAQARETRRRHAAIDLDDDAGFAAAPAAPASPRRDPAVIPWADLPRVEGTLLDDDDHVAHGPPMAPPLDDDRPAPGAWWDASRRPTGAGPAPVTRADAPTPWAPAKDPWADAADTDPGAPR